MKIDQQRKEWYERGLVCEGPTFRVIGERRAIITEDYDCGDFIVPAGFQFDGATMPWWSWSALRLDPFGRISGSAAPHDLLYVNLGRVRGKHGEWLFYSEDEADHMFHVRTKDCGLNGFQRVAVHGAVRLFGHYDHKQKSNCAIWNREWLVAYNNSAISFQAT